MIKFGSRLIFALISLIAVVLVCLALLLGQLFKGYYLNNFDKRLGNESGLLSALVLEKGGVYAVTQSELEHISQELDVRLTLVDSNGEIVLDSLEKIEAINKKHKQVISKILQGNKTQKTNLELVSGNDLHYFGSPVVKNNEIQGYVFISAKVGEVDRANREIWWLLSVSLGIALILIILLGVKITNYYTKPIEAATNVAIELSKGNYKARTYEDQRKETSMLSKSINILARNFQEIVSNQEIQQERLTTLIENMGSGLILIDSRGFVSLINRTYKEVFKVKPNEYLNKLYYDVIEHKKIAELVEEIFMTEQRVRRQFILPLSIERRYFEVFGSPIIGLNNEWKGVLLVFHDITELKKLEQMRKDFVANVSHELKTPITSIKGFSETLLDGAMNDKATLEAFLSIILKESDRLQTLIKDLLDLSKIEQQGFQLNIEQLDIMLLLDEIRTMLDGKAVEKNIHLHLVPNTYPLFVDGDYYRLKQVFINLIINAIHYTPSDGVVEIAVREKESKVLIDIKDTGIGIEKEEIPRIFERFYRVDKARSRNSGGTGLGLAIVKHIVEAHKGSISVESVNNEGATFTISLKKSLAQ
jgi:two-component system, OmpR family, phosphate regulon sensor histidine kinase PhoR